MGNCRCCGGCCQCDRLVKSVVINFDGVDYDIQINKTLKQINCFYPIYIGDAVSTWRYESISGVQKYVRSFYKSVEITIDFQDPASLTDFNVMECDNSPSIYSMHKKSKNDSKLILYWGDERFLGSTIVLEYRGKKFNLYLGGSVVDSEIASYLQSQIHQFGVTNNFPELADTIISVKRENLTPGAPLITGKVLTSSKAVEQEAKTRCIGGSTDVELLWYGYTCGGFGVTTTRVTGHGVHSTTLCWSSEGVPETTYATGKYTTNILGFYITLVYDGIRILVTPYFNYIDENETISDMLIRNGYVSGSSFYIRYNASETHCGSSLISNATGNGCAGGGLHVGQGPGNL